MSTRMTFTHVHLRAEAGAVTGSIQRVCAGHASNASSITNWVTGKFYELTYDDGSTASVTGSQNEVHHTGASAIAIPAGKCVDGPFIGFTTDADPMLIYHVGSLTSS